MGELSVTHGTAFTHRIKNNGTVLSWSSTESGVNAAQSGRCCLGGVSDARRKPSGGVDVGGAAGEGSTQQASEQPEATDAAPTPTGADASTPTATAPNRRHGG